MPFQPPSTFQAEIERQTASSNGRHLCLIGAGPSALYLLHILRLHLGELKVPLAQVSVVEQREDLGMGMPYHPETTDRFNLCNISSAELPDLGIRFADWLRNAGRPFLADFGLTPEHIDEEEVYPRILVGLYFRERFENTLRELKEQGIRVDRYARVRATDVTVDDDERPLVILENSERFTCDQLVIATGHHWSAHADQPEKGFFASPWPIKKLLPEEGKSYDFEIGILGASLSAFDVVNSLARRHGSFVPADGGRGLVYRPDPHCRRFRLTMHSANGRLPQLVYGQMRPFREIYRHVSAEGMRELIDLRSGRLRLDDYFTTVCRPALRKAAREDGVSSLERLLEDDRTRLEDMISHLEKLTRRCEAFEQLKRDYSTARRMVRDDVPTRWKEVLDDLVYTLNYHAEHLSAGDHFRLKRSLMPFLMNVIAALPLASAEVLIALHESGRLTLESGHVKIDDVDEDGVRITIGGSDGPRSKSFRMFVDCSGQDSVSADDFPFPTLARDGWVSQPLARFAEDEKLEDVPEESVVVNGEGRFLRLPGIAVDESFRLRRRDGRVLETIQDVSFPHCIGVRPYAYGLQACCNNAAMAMAPWLRQAVEGERLHRESSTISVASADKSQVVAEDAPETGE